MMNRPVFTALAALLISSSAHAKSVSRGAQTAPAPAPVVSPVALPSAQMSGLKLLISPAGVFNPDDLPPVRVGAPAVPAESAASSGQSSAPQAPAAHAPASAQAAPVALAPAVLAAAPEALSAADRARPGAVQALAVLTAAPVSEPASVAEPGRTARAVFDGSIARGEAVSAPAVSGRAGTPGRLSRWTARAASAAAFVAAPAVALAQDVSQSAAASAAAPVLLMPAWLIVAAGAALGLLVLMPRPGAAKPSREAVVSTLAGVGVFAAAVLAAPLVAIPLLTLAAGVGFWTGAGVGVSRLLGASDRAAAALGVVAAVAMAGAKVAAFGLPAIAVGAFAAIFIAKLVSGTPRKPGVEGLLDAIGSTFGGMMIGFTLPIWATMWAGPRIAAKLRSGGGSAAAFLAASASGTAAMPLDPQGSYLAALYLVAAGVMAWLHLAESGAPRSAYVGTGVGALAMAVATLGFPAFALPFVVVASVAGFLAGGGAGVARVFGASPRLATVLGLAAAGALAVKALAFGLPAVAVGAAAAIFVARFTALAKEDHGGLGIIIAPLRGMLLGLTIPVWLGMWAGPKLTAALRRAGSGGAAGFAAVSTAAPAAWTLPAIPDAALWVGGIAAFVGLLFGSIPDGDASRITFWGALRGAAIGGLGFGGVAAAYASAAWLVPGLIAASAGALVWIYGLGRGGLFTAANLQRGVNEFPNPGAAKRTWANRAPQRGLVSGRYWFFGERGMNPEEISLMRDAFANGRGGADALTLLLKNGPGGDRPAILALYSGDLFSGLEFTEAGLGTPYGFVPWKDVRGAIPWRYRSDG